MSDSEQEIKELLKQGRHREAAEQLIELGDMARAMEAYATVWDYGRAAEVALAAGDRAAALDYLLHGGDRAGAADVRARLVEAPAAEAERAVELLLGRGEKDQAARLLEARGELERAAELIRGLGEMRRAATLLERAGHYREAGRLYERLVTEDPDDHGSALHLGNILRRFGKNELAAQMLQSAAREPKLRRLALRGLVVALHDLGLRDAAATALEELLDVDGSAPRTVDALVASEADTGRGQQAEEEGQWIGGRYEVLRVLGGGAAGRVYLARDALYEREVALKVLAAGAANSGGRDAFTRFAREAQIAAKLDHPNIVRALDFDSEAGVLVMEHLGGGTLADRISQDAIPVPLVREVFLAVLAALETAHLRGVIHRDVKPQNILFDRGGGVKLADFGVAHLQDLGLTQTGAFIGTLTYMAPEQITGDRLGAGTDLYGLGASMFHALCGRPPFVGADLLRQHLSEEPPTPGSIRPALGDRFDALFARLLAKSTDGRFASVAEVRRMVQALDFTEPEAEEVAPPPPPEPIESDQPQETYVGTQAEQEVSGGRARRARHRTLDLGVSLLKLTDAGRLEGLKAMGRAVSPHLQAVLDLDAERGEVVLEEPEGERLAERLTATGRLETSEALELVTQVARALEALHEAGVTHGQVDPAHVVIAEGRATLLLPTTPGGDAEADIAAAAGILGRAVGAPGLLEPLLEAGPLVEALGELRAEALRSERQGELDLAGLCRLTLRARALLDERRHAREHLHAAAAAARAAGADPRQGELARFLERRRAELDL